MDSCTYRHPAPEGASEVSADRREPGAQSADIACAPVLVIADRLHWIMLGRPQSGVAGAGRAVETEQVAPPEEKNKLTRFLHGALKERWVRHLEYYSVVCRIDIHHLY